MLVQRVKALLALAVVQPYTAMSGATAMRAPS